MLEVSNKGIELALRWDDKITDNFSYWVVVIFKQQE
jgi:hypothetical protein